MTWDSEIVIVQGGSRSEVVGQAGRLRRYLGETPDVPLRDIAYTFNTELQNSTLHLAIVASTLAELDRKLGYALQRLSDPDCRRIKDVSGIYFSEKPLAREGQLAFLFPGEGSQYVNMLADLCMHFPEIRACFDLADRVFLDNNRGYVPSQVVFPPPLEAQRETSAIWQVDCAVASVFAVNRGLVSLLSRLGVTPDAIVGHSSGEYAALLAAGALEISGEEELLQHALHLNTLYASVEDRIPAAVLVAVGAVRSGAVQAVMEQSPGPLYITMDNCPNQIVLCGTEASAGKAIEGLRSRGAICSILPFRRGYHTPLFEPVAEELDRFFRRLRVVPPKTTIYSCLTAQPFPQDAEEIRRLAVAQWSAPVRFRETIEAMYSAGVRIFVEVGPRGNLTGFVEDVLRGEPFLSVPMNVAHRSGLTQLNHALGLLAAQGVSLGLDHLYVRRRPRRLAFDRAEAGGLAKKPLMRLALELPVAHVPEGSPVEAEKARPGTSFPSARVPRQAPSDDGQPESVPLLPVLQGAAFQPPSKEGLAATEEPRAAPAAGPQVSAAARSRLMGEYLRTMERFLDVQQEVIRSFLAGAAPGTVPPAARPPVQEPPRISPNVLSLAPRDSTLPQPAAAEKAAPAIEQGAPSGVAARRDDPVARFLALVSEKTGYPVEMLDLSLNMEADLGIDSIKRVEILGTFQRDTGLIRPEEMEKAASLKTLQEVIDHFTRKSDVRPPAPVPAPERTADQGSSPTSGPGPGPATETRRAPFIRKVVSLTAGEEAVVACTLDARNDLFLRHHTIGGRPSILDDSLSAMAVVPLTMSLEIMAEAAALLVPEKLLIGMKEVRAPRWFAPENDTRSIVVCAKRKRSERQQAVEVQILEADEQALPARTGRLIIEGTVVFGDEYQASPPGTDFELRDERPYRYLPQEFYRAVMFHGPIFQSVISIDRCGEDGAEATVKSGEETGFFRSMPEADFLLDPVLLDAAGQLVGFWTADRLESGFVVFPVGFEVLELYGPAPKTPGPIVCRTRSRLLGDGRVRSDIDFVGPGGRTIARFIGWEDVRFDFPRRFVRFILSPGETVLSEPWPEAVERLPCADALQCCRLRRVDLPQALFDGGGPIWQQVWARIMLNPQEYERWRLLQVPEKRRAEWLLGRLAAKDAVRQFHLARYGVQLCPADIEIASDQQGAPMVRGSWIDTTRGAPSISLAHSGGVAVAVAGECGPSEGIGIDIEVVRDLPRELTAAFSTAERALLANLEAASPEWTIRFWCAKEAVGKAMGLGLVAGPLGVIIREFDANTGSVMMTPAEQLARRLGVPPDTAFVSHTRRDGEIIVATALARRPGDRGA